MLVMIVLPEVQGFNAKSSENLCKCNNARFINKLILSSSVVGWPNLNIYYLLKAIY